MGKVKVGVIGVGSISEMHFGGYHKNNEAELVGVCDLSADRAKEKADRFGAPDAKIYTDYYELLANPDVEAVSIRSDGSAMWSIPGAGHLSTYAGI
ncbi:predicted dehydrogenase [Paenibacillus popilliae ATCC 14706]|uniref:Predicted dehydrogenase n=1 Tax=Paenibacillus popilliae ATCC 14706 TaxID=1212764 RepID=M9L925_PAEPP|nr:predicted dehydrogenase [Paenibacillus popilliae ATCC 14706]